MFLFHFDIGLCNVCCDDDDDDDDAVNNYWLDGDGQVKLLNIKIKTRGYANARPMRYILTLS